LFYLSVGYYFIVYSNRLKFDRFNNITQQQGDQGGDPKGHPKGGLWTFLAAGNPRSWAGLEAAQRKSGKGICWAIGAANRREHHKKQKKRFKVKYV
jgi:hypothetical protein